MDVIFTAMEITRNTGESRTIRRKEQLISKMRLKTSVARLDDAGNLRTVLISNGELDVVSNNDQSRKSDFSGCIRKIESILPRGENQANIGDGFLESITYKCDRSHKELDERFILVFVQPNRN